MSNARALRSSPNAVSESSLGTKLGPGVPSEIASRLEVLRDQAVAAATGNLLSLAIYGGVARGRFRLGYSDVNVIAVLRDAGPAAMTQLTPSLRSAWREIRVEPLVLSQQELELAASAFAVKFLDIAENHVVLHGVAPLTPDLIPPERLRGCIEQSLGNLTLRLRRRIAWAQGDPTTLHSVLAETARPAAIAMLHLLRLSRNNRPEVDHTAAIFKAAAAAFGLESSSLEFAAALRHDRGTPGTNPQALAEQYLANVQKLWRIAAEASVA